MTITPQPQPASYWIDLLEELTGGIPLEINRCIHKPTKLSYYIMMYAKIDDNMYKEFILNACYIESGQSVIDAAVEYHEEYPYGSVFRAEDNLRTQVQLYKRCNGIKD